WQIPFTGNPPDVSQSGYLVAGGHKYSFPCKPAKLFFTGALSVAEKFEAARALQSLTTINPATLGRADMREWLDRNVRRRGGRRLIAALIRVSTYSNDMQLLSAAAAIRQMQSALAQGVIYVDGGWQTLVSGLAAKARSLGVRISAGIPVERVEHGRIRLAGGES